MKQLKYLLSFILLLSLGLALFLWYTHEIARHPRVYTPQEVTVLIGEAKKGNEQAIKKLMTYITLQEDSPERLQEFIQIAHEVKDFSIEFALFQELLWKNKCKTEKLVYNYTRTLSLFDDNEVKAPEYKKDSFKELADTSYCTGEVAIKIDEVIDLVVAP